MKVKTKLQNAVIATILAVGASMIAAPATAATLKAGSCRGVSTPQGYKYIGTYCVDFRCTVTTTLMFDSWCPYSVDV